MSRSRSRLNDTAALVAMPSTRGHNENSSTSMSVRRIDNGYIVSKSSCHGDHYESSESYSPQRPSLEATDGAGANMLSETKRYMED